MMFPRMSGNDGHTTIAIFNFTTNNNIINAMACLFGRHMFHLHVRKPLRRLGRVLVCAPRMEYEEYEFEGARVRDGSRRTKVSMDMRPPIPQCAPLMIPSCYWDEPNHSHSRLLLERWIEPELR